MYSPDESYRPQRPKLPSFARYESIQPSLQPGPRNLLDSCRALQSMLGGPYQPTVSPVPEASPVRPTPQSNPFSLNQMVSSQQRPAGATRNSSKRGRDDYEDEAAMEVDEWQTAAEERDLYQTPKRQRTFAPLDMPLGLKPSDFSHLPIGLDRKNSDQSDQSIEDRNAAPSLYQQQSYDDSEPSQYPFYSDHNNNAYYYPPHQQSHDMAFTDSDLQMFNSDTQMEF